MAFIDLFSSAKGPGVIGMIMALIVLLGFGLLFMLVFEEGGQGGGKSLSAIVRDNAREIDSQKSRLEIGEATLARMPRLKKTEDDLVTAKLRNTTLSTGISTMTADAEALETDLAALKQEWEGYKNQYRAHIRAEAVGTKMPELRTADGRVYRGVVISKVTAIGIDIRHDEGLGRVNFEQLPEEIRDLYQYDENQMIAAATKEAETRAGLARAVAKAEEAAKDADEEQKALDTEETKRNLVAQIASKEAQASAIEEQIQQLESDISSAESAASAARAAGRRHLNKSGPLRQTLNRKRGELVQIRTEIARIRSSL
jgi:chromosome segregation ATPase